MNTSCAMLCKWYPFSFLMPTFFLLFKQEKKTRFLSCSQRLIFQRKMISSPRSKSRWWLDKQSVPAFPSRSLLASGWERETRTGPINLKEWMHYGVRGESPSLFLHRHKQGSTQLWLPLTATFWSQGKSALDWSWHWQWPWIKQKDHKSLMTSLGYSSSMLLHFSEFLITWDISLNNLLFKPGEFV